MQQDAVGKKKTVAVDESVLDRADPADVMEFHDWPMPLPDDAGRVRAAHPPPGQVPQSPSSAPPAWKLMEGPDQSLPRGSTENVQVEGGGSDQAPLMARGGRGASPWPPSPVRLLPYASSRT